jgi:hypothetical protein
MKKMKRKNQKKKNNNNNVEMNKALGKALAETEGRDWLAVQVY